MTPADDDSETTAPFLFHRADPDEGAGAETFYDLAMTFTVVGIGALFIYALFLTR